MAVQRFSDLAPPSAQPVEAFGLDGTLPRWAMAPPDRSGVAQVLKAAADGGLVCVPWGGGARQEMGYPPARYDVALSTENLNRVVDWQAGDLTVTVEAGLSLLALQELLGTRRQFVALESPEPARETIGGLLASGSSALLRYSYGPPRDQVIGVAVALPGGSVVHGGGRVVKNVAGYDLCKLFTGSQGTLGVVVEATLRVRPLPKATRTWLGSFSSAGAAEDALAALMDSPLQPSFFQVLDPAAAARLVPGGPAGWTIALGADGGSELSEWSAAEASTIAQVEGRVLEGADSAAQRERLIAACAAGGALSARLSVLSSDVFRVLEACREYATGKSGLRIEGVSAAANGVIYLDCTGHTDSADWAPPLVEWLNRQAHEREGYCTLLRAPAGLRQHLPMWGKEIPSVDLQRGIRRQLDPAYTLNRGRLFPDESPGSPP